MKRAFGVIAALLLVLGLASGCSDGGDGGSTSAVTSDSALPDGFPIFEGSRFDSGGVDQRDGVDTFQGVWQTSAEAEAVREFFERELNGEWRIIETTENGGATVIRVERVGGDEPESGTVVINDGPNGTTIVKTISKGTPDPDEDEEATDEDDDDGQGGSTPTGGSASLPSGYPSDRVPLPADASVTSAAGPSEPGDRNEYSIEFSSGSTEADLVDFFTTTLAGEGWELTQQIDDGRNFLLVFNDGGDSVSASGQSTSTGSIANVLVTLGE